MSCFCKTTTKNIYHRIFIKGLIALDGGVNIKTAPLLKNYPIDKVSVGSYFSKSNDLQSDLNLLNQTLN